MLLLTTLAFANPPQARPPSAQIDVNGRKMTAIVHKPKVSKPPVVIVYHGIGGNPGPLAKGWLPQARKHDFMVILPSVGKGGGAYFGGKKPTLANLDPALFDALRDWAVAQGADPDRVYVAGFSMGAHYAASVYCRGVDIAGVSLYGMSMEAKMWSSCAPKRPMPAVYAAARGDRYAKAGTLTVGKHSARLKGPSKTEDLLAHHNQCTGRTKKKIGKTKIFKGTCKAPLSRVVLPGSLHRFLRNDFDAARFSWRVWSAQRD